MKDKNHTIISIDAEKAFDKSQHPFMIKTQQNGIRGNIPNHNKAMCDSTDKLHVFPLRWVTRQG